MLPGFSGSIPPNPAPSGGIPDEPSGTSGDIDVQTQATVETIIAQDIAHITEVTADNTAARFGA
jgi:hypothetical protein